MKNIAIVNGIGLSPYAFQKIGGSKSSFERVMEFCRGLPDLEKTLVLADSPIGTPKSVQRIERDDWNQQSVLQVMEQESKAFDNLIYFYGDCPFLDPSVTEKMYKSHLAYYADYTFADGYPNGISPEILSTDTLNRLQGLLDKKKDTVERSMIFDIIKKDINAFDVETEISPKDLRLLRADLHADSRSNFLLIQRITERGASDSLSILRILGEAPQILRILPSFFNIQIVEGCPQNCTYCPYPDIRGHELGKKGEMDRSLFETILEQIKEYSETATVSISLWGESSLHSQVADLAADVLVTAELDLIVETCGIGWKDEVLDRMRDRVERSPCWIVSLDAWSREVYEKLRGDGFDEVLTFIDKLEQRFPENVYVQAVRMKENEDDLEQFYRNWKTRSDHLIIQKYDHFSGKLPDRRVADLSPVKRFPCWHVKRDVTVLINGDAILCREDLDRKYLLGNLESDTLDKIWERGIAYYDQHISGEYPDLCKECDEYYTFNF